MKRERTIMSKNDLEDRVSDMEDKTPYSSYLGENVPWCDEDDFDWDALDELSEKRYDFEDMAKEYDFHNRY